jgi:hypothetical protein
VFEYVIRDGRPNDGPDSLGGTFFGANDCLDAIVVDICFDLGFGAVF